VSSENEIVLVTGASRGIGRAIALACAQAGASVVLVARSEAQLEQVASAIREKNGTAMVVQADLTDRAAVDGLVARVIDRFGRIDVLVNNAGTNHIANLVMMTDEALRSVFELNVFSVFRLTKAVIRHMIRAKSGRIINIASIAAKVGVAYGSAYSSSKAALLGFTRSLARETAQLGITVNAICPWHVDTELVREAMEHRGKMFGKKGDEYLKEIAQHNPQKRLIEATEVAAVTLFLMSHEARGITGQSINVCGGTVMD
jgi:NAD(P)-dependent dehydrogenase (short-subunit alcohol dehydrogenase family)